MVRISTGMLCATSAQLLVLSISCRASCSLHDQSSARHSCSVVQVDACHASQKVPDEVGGLHTCAAPACCGASGEGQLAIPKQALSMW